MSSNEVLAGTLPDTKSSQAIPWNIKEADFDAEAACSLSVEYNSLAWRKEKTSQTLTLTKWRRVNQIKNYLKTGKKV